MFGASLLTPVLVVWAAVTGTSIVVLIRKSLLGFRENGFVILDPAEASQAAEQRAIVAKVDGLASLVNASALPHLRCSCLQAAFGSTESS